MNTRSTYDRTAALAMARWVNASTTDELGTLVDSIWSLGRAAPEWCPELVEHARGLMEHGLNGEADPGDPKSLKALADLLEKAAGRLKTAAQILDDDRGRAKAS